MSTPKQPADLPHESTDPTSEPRTLGRYQLLAKIASGGMASVFLARSGGAAGFEKLVALKRIHPHLAEEQSFVDMFLDEARIASRIQHANVCSVFDFGDADGSFFIAMEYLVGEPFARVLKACAKSRKHYEDPRHPYLVARAIADACEGLHAAHELRGRDGELLNVVHRDISPQNLFLTYDGNVKVVDFGIASAADRVHHTQGGEVKGKFSYMAPEQAKGAKGGALDRRADVFALGIVLWEMLTLKRLFRRDTPAETLYALIGEDIPLPSTQRANVPADIDPIVMKALARNPAERYASARELGRDLLRFIGKSGEPVGMADLADWMERLLPEERAASRKTVDAAQAGEASVVLQPSQTGDLSGSDVVAESSKVHMRPETAATRPSLSPRASVTPSSARVRQPSAPSATPSPRLPGAPTVPRPSAFPPAAAPARSSLTTATPGPSGSTSSPGNVFAPRPSRRPSVAPPPAAAPLPRPAPLPVQSTIEVDGQAIDGDAVVGGHVDGDTVEATAPGVFDGGDFDGAPTTFRVGDVPVPTPSFTPPPQGAIPQRQIVTTQLARGEEKRSRVVPIALGVAVVLLLVVGGLVVLNMTSHHASEPVAVATHVAPPVLPPTPLVPMGSDDHGDPAALGGGRIADHGDPTHVAPPIPPVPPTHGNTPPSGGGDPIPPPEQHPAVTAHGDEHAGHADPPPDGHESHHNNPPHVHVVHAPAPDATGFVQVVTPGGWANVFDSHGRPLGQTPTRVELPAGHQTLTIRPFGQPPNQHADVTVNPGATVRLSVPVSGG